MKVRVTFELDDRCLRAVGYHYGKMRPATRREVVGWLDALVTATLEDLTSEYDDEVAHRTRRGITPEGWEIAHSLTPGQTEALRDVPAGDSSGVLPLRPLLSETLRRRGLLETCPGAVRTRLYRRTRLGEEVAYALGMPNDFAG